MSALLIAISSAVAFTIGALGLLLWGTKRWERPSFLNRIGIWGDLLHLFCNAGCALGVLSIIAWALVRAPWYSLVAAVGISAVTILLVKRASLLMHLVGVFGPILGSVSLIALTYIAWFTPAGSRRVAQSQLIDANRSEQVTMAIAVVIGVFLVIGAVVWYRRRTEHGSAAIGVGGQGPETGLDKFIEGTYGKNARKTADLKSAIELARDQLLGGVFPEEDVFQLAQELYSGPMPYSTHDLAVSVALGLFSKVPVDRREALMSTQLQARMQVGSWLTEGKVAPLLAKIFEDALYRDYHPENWASGGARK